VAARGTTVGGREEEKGRGRAADEVDGGWPRRLAAGARCAGAPLWGWTAVCSAVG
jgi:hypothetical protein